MNIERGEKIRQLIGIEYPGRVENVDKMIETLGGEQEISKAFEQKQKLQLKFNPKNLYCKPAISSEQEEVTGMLLKLKIRRVNDNPETKVEYLSAELVGTVKSMYKFNNFSDYQYLPLQKDEATGETKNIYHDIVPEDPVAGESWFREKKDVPIFLPPVTFCRSDTVQSSMLRNEQKLFSDVENDEIVKFAVTSRSSRHGSGIMIQYSNDIKIPVPSKPVENIDLSKSNIIGEEELKIIVDLFKERPIWTLAALRAHIRDPPKRLSRVLESLAFYYSTGPWRNCFVRFGFDPRQDFSSRYYQMLDYRVRQGAGFKVDAQTKKTSAIGRRIRVHPYSNLAPLTEEIIEEKYVARQKEGIFDENTLPPFRARQYQFKDIHLPKVQEMLENLPGPMDIECNEKRGWLPAQFIEDVRKMLTNIAQANMMKLCKEKNLPFDETTESIADSVNEDVFDENESESSDSDDNVSIHEAEDMEIDHDLK